LDKKNGKASKGLPLKTRREKEEEATEFKGRGHLIFKTSPDLKQNGGKGRESFLEKGKGERREKAEPLKRF